MCGHYLAWPLGRDRFRTKESIRFLLGLCDRPSPGPAFFRSVVDGGHSRAGATAGLQPWNTSGIFDTSIRASAVQCHPQFYRFYRRLFNDMASLEASGLGAVRVESPYFD